MNAARALALGLCLASAWATPITLEQSEDVPSIREREIATLCVNLRDESEYVLVPGHGLLCPPNMLRAATGAYADTIHVSTTTPRRCLQFSSQICLQLLRMLLYDVRALASES